MSKYEMEIPEGYLSDGPPQLVNPDDTHPYMVLRLRRLPLPTVTLEGVPLETARYLAEMPWVDGTPYDALAKAARAALAAGERCTCEPCRYILPVSRGGLECKRERTELHADWSGGAHSWVGDIDPACPQHGDAAVEQAR